MSWQDEYRSALQRAIWKHGRPVREGSESELYYGWVDYKSDEHVKKCEIVFASEPEEDQWNQFVDTFYEGDTDQHGVSMNAQCKCGTTFKMRWRCHPGEMMRVLLREET